MGDNLIQNFPLRVLVGTDLRHGHLPLWDPYLWSGAPLLAGFNAGAAYPTTALFAVLPGALAWVLNQLAVEVVAAAGVLALLRVLGRSWLASGLAAAAFAFGGFMTAQSVHLDLVQAAAWLPWAFVAVDRLAHRPDGPLGGALGGAPRRLARPHDPLGRGRAHLRRRHRPRPLRRLAGLAHRRPPAPRRPPRSGGRRRHRPRPRPPPSSCPGRPSRPSRSGPCTATRISPRAR